MATTVDVESMMAEQRKRPDLFSLRYSDELGAYLSFQINLPFDQNPPHRVWRQNRAYRGKRFDLSGCEDSPSPSVAAIWSELDFTFDSFRAHCFGLLRIHVERQLASELSSGPELVPRSCFETIRDSVADGSVEINGIRFWDRTWYEVHLEYFRWEDYYLTPLIRFNDHRVVAVEVVP